MRQQKNPPENIKLKVILYIGKCSNLLLRSFIYNLSQSCVWRSKKMPSSVLVEALRKKPQVFKKNIKFSMPDISSCILCYFHTYYGMNNDSASRTADYLLNKPNQHQFQTVFIIARHSSKHTESKLNSCSAFPGRSWGRDFRNGSKKEPPTFSSLKHSSSWEITLSERSHFIN